MNTEIKKLNNIPLTEKELNAFGAELEAIRERVLADLGERDANYIRKLVRVQRGMAIAGRACLFASIFPPAWVAGTALLGTAKILDNMEIGHNIMHGQYDWMQDPNFNSKNYDWDTACPGDQWRHSHNYMHHTYTNIVGKDRDVGYGILRMDESQEWRPYYLGNPVYAFLLAVFFQYGVALHDVEVDQVLAGKRSPKEAFEVLKGVWKKVRGQTLKDYVLFPLLAGPFFIPVFLGNAVANLMRNLWSYTIIFCGHFPDGVATFTEEECKNESKGHWYYRQLLGSANLTGGKLFHILSGNLSHQIEHHLFPDIPAHRYAEISIEVQEICERYGLPYNKGPLSKQFATVVRRIFRLALPNSKPAAPSSNNDLPLAA